MGRPVLLVINALNETRPRTVWRDQLDRVAAMIGCYDRLRVLFTVRSHYRPQVIPDELDLPVVVHRAVWRKLPVCRIAACTRPPNSIGMSRCGWR